MQLDHWHIWYLAAVRFCVEIDERWYCPNVSGQVQLKLTIRRVRVSVCSVSAMLACCKRYRLSRQTLCSAVVTRTGCTLGE